MSVLDSICSAAAYGSICREVLCQKAKNCGIIGGLVFFWEHELGNPLHFGIELPQRCLTLVEELWDHAAKVYGGERRDLGPLTTTFMISMSMPIINLPVERIERQISNGANEGLVDDRHRDEMAVSAFRDTVQRGNFGEAPFFKEGAWRFVGHEGNTANFARELPDEIAGELDTPQALTNAASMQASQWISVLRNALAHGGIVYLDERGRSSHVQPVKMLAFVSGRFADGVCPNAAGKQCRGERGSLTGVNILRISEHDYLDFLHRWVKWLVEAGISRPEAT